MPKYTFTDPSGKKYTSPDMPSRAAAWAQLSTHLGIGNSPPNQPSSPAQTGPQPTNTTPIPTPPLTPEQALSPSLAGQSLRTGSAYTPQEQQAMQGGTDISSGAPWGLRNEFSFMVDPTQQASTAAINKYFGKPVGSVGPMGPQFVNPQTGRNTLVNPSPTASVTSSSPPTIGGSMDMALDTAGAAGGAGAALAATKNPFAAYGMGVAGTGAAQYISNLGKNVVAKYYYGLPDSDIKDQQSADARNAAGAAGGQALFSAPGLAEPIGRFANYGFTGLGSTKALQKLYSAALNAREGLGDFKDLLGNAAANFSLAIHELLPGEIEKGNIFRKAATLEGATSGRLGTGTPLVNLEYQRTANNSDALSNSMDVVTNQYLPNAGYQYGEGSEGAALAVGRQKMMAKNQIDLERAQAANELTARTQGIQSPIEASKIALEPFVAVKNAAREQANEAWGNLKVSLGVPQEEAFGGAPYTQPMGEAPTIGYSDSTRSRLSQVVARGVSALRSKAPGSRDIAHNYFDSIPDELYHDYQRPGIGLIWDEPDQKFMTKDEQEAMGGDEAPYKQADDPQHDLNWYIENIKARRGGTRSQFKPDGSMRNPDAAIDKNVTDILRSNADQELATTDPHTLAQWEEAEDATKNFHDTFQHGILKMADGDYAGLDNPPFSQFLNKVLYGGNPVELEHFASIAKQHPYLQNHVGLSLLSIMDDALHGISPERVPQVYADMSQKLRPAMRAFLGKDEFDNYQALVKKVSDLNDKYQSFNNEWKLTDFGEGIPASVPNIRSILYNPNTTAQKAGRLYAFLLRNNPDLLDGVKADVAKAFADKVAPIGSGGRNINLSKINQLIGDKSTQAKIRLFLGGHYIDQVNSIGQAAKMAQGAPEVGTSKPISLVQNAVRWLVAPPLSREGRLYSLILGWRQRASARLLYNALSSPEGLKSLIDQRVASGKSAATLSVLGGLQAGSLASQLPSNPVGQPTTDQSGTQP